MRIKRVHWLASCLLCVVMAFCASACAVEMPQIDGELEQNDYPPTYQEDVIDMEALSIYISVLSPAVSAISLGIALGSLKKDRQP